MQKNILIFIFILPFFFSAQRRNIFDTSNKRPFCSIIKLGTFYEFNYPNDSIATKTLSRTISFRKNIMKESWFHGRLIFKSNIKYLSNCKFSSEIIKIKTKLDLQNFHEIGNKTIYEIVETGKNYVILEYACNEGRNTCTLILDKK